ncbi:MAG: hypothetical protein Q9200_006507 [Gallowayella weberi]
MSRILNQLGKLEKLAAADAAGDARAHRQLLKGIDDLRLAVETPAETMSRVHFLPMQNIASRIAIEKKWLHILVASDGQAVTAAHIAKRTDTDEFFVSMFV